MPRNIANILSRCLSVILFPLLPPTYLIAAFCALFSSLILPLPFWYWAIAIAGTAFFTLIIPMLVLLILKRAGQIKDLDVSNRNERLVPFLYTLVSVCFWCAFLKYVMHVPIFLYWTALASTLALCVAMIITLWWKISAHLTSMGGMTGMVIGMMLYFGINSPICICLLFIISLLLAYARIYLNAHTPSQTVAGYLLGLVFTLTPNIILLYV